ncbi:MAG: SUMF1/EgtB/PvdO family nonheme iron enzyme [Deltaproteobacteria bacterium]|nr:SUMF1/EgtB/PvdO family nonheme iron enzyme [Deltaproteobacteria bacterium]
MDDLAATLTLIWQAHTDEGGFVSLVDVLSEAGVQIPPTPGVIPTSPAYSNTVRSLGVKGLPPALGRHILLSELGAGGMGRVIEARDPDLRRTVAIKVIANPARVTAAQVARFVAEAQTSSQLEHPNIVPVYDLGLTPDGHIYFVMKKVEGRSLREVVQALRKDDEGDRSHFTLRRLMAMFVQICNAVAYAHDRGVLHRDLKPDNVMVGQFGEVLVMDWGVARVIGDTSEEVGTDFKIERMSLPPTLDGVAVGTPGYMSPEQATGDLEALDPRSDVWSLGAMLYELVTWERAFVGGNLFHLILVTSQSNPEDPRTRAPDRRVPDEVAEIVLKALAQRPEDRHQSALELGSAVEQFLEGSRRREAASRHLAEARRKWDLHLTLTEEEGRLRRREKQLLATIPRWAPLEEKMPLLELRDRLRAIAPQRATAYGDVLGQCEKALSQDPENAVARGFLADVFVQNFLDAEGTAEEAHFAERVRQYDDDGRHAALLKGEGSITLRTDPAGAEVVARPVVRDGLVWGMGDEVALGRTPLVEKPLGHGSWVLTLSSDGKADTTYPVFIERCGHWDGGAPVPLYRHEEIGDGWVYVPPGPALLGGDEKAVDSWSQSWRQVPGFFAAVFPVTNSEYCAFLNALHDAEPGSGSGRCPRKESYMEEGAITRMGGGTLYWTPPDSADARWVVPEKDNDGDAWGMEWPVFSITWEDSQEYAAWLGEQLGLGREAVRLPFETEWAKMARGTDGRFFPWGDDFDPALCKMRHSREGRNLPEPVGAFPLDRSVYGARDIAGSIREMCQDSSFDGDDKRRPVRGGSWRASDVPCRAAYRFGHMKWHLFTSIGFRVIRTEPIPCATGSEPVEVPA